MFGHVVTGMDVVDQLIAGDVIRRVRVWDGVTGTPALEQTVLLPSTPSKKRRKNYRFLAAFFFAPLAKFFLRHWFSLLKV